MKKRHYVFGALVALSLFSLASCGDENGKEPEPAPEAPVIEERNQSVYDILTSDDEEVSAQPQEIVTEQEDTLNIQKQPQNSVILDINEIDDEDEEENSGINIDYQ